MTVRNLDFLTPKPASGDIPAQRLCLSCKDSFWSEGFGERICKQCKTHSSWKSGISAGDGGTRRRSAK